MINFFRKKQNNKFLIIFLLFSMSFSIVLSISYEKFRSNELAKIYVDKDFVSTYLNTDKKITFLDLKDELNEMSDVYFIPTADSYNLKGKSYPIYLTNLSENMLEIPLISGRFFNNRDKVDMKNVAIVNQTLRNSIKGNSIKIDDINYKIVGVMNNYNTNGILTAPVYLNTSSYLKNNPLSTIELQLSSKNSDQNINKLKSKKVTILENNISVSKIGKTEIIINPLEIFRQDFLPIFFISLICLILISFNSYADERYKLGIKKMIGIKNNKIIIDFITDKIILIIFGSLLGETLHLTLYKIFPSIFPMVYQELFIYTILYLLSINMIISLIISLIIIKLSPKSLLEVK